MAGYKIGFRLDIGNQTISDSVSVQTAEVTNEILEKRQAGVLGNVKYVKDGFYEVGDVVLTMSTKAKIGDIINSTAYQMVTVYFKDVIEDLATHTKSYITTKCRYWARVTTRNLGEITTDDMDGYVLTLSAIDGVEEYTDGVEKFYYYPKQNVCRVNGVSVVETFE